MSWHFNVYSVVYFMTAAVSAAVVLYAWRRRTIPEAMVLVWLMVAGGEWALAGGLEAAAVGIPAKVFWAKVGYIGAGAGPVLFLIFALAYSHPTRLLSRRGLALAWVIPIAMILLAATNEWHHLIWTDFTPGTVGDNILIYHHGVFFYIAVTYFYLIIAWSALILIRAAVRRSRLYRGQTFAVIAGAVMPLASTGLYVAGLSPVPGLDISPIGFMFAGLALVWGVLRFHLLDLAPVARDLLFESMSDGALVLDLQNRIVDINPAAQQLVGATTDVIGQSAQILLAARPDLVETFWDLMEGQAEVLFGDPTPRHLDLRISPVRDRRRRITGHLVLIRDITERKRAEDALRESEATYRAMFAKNQAVKLLIDPETAAIVDANEAACCFYGYSLGQIKAKKISDINILPESEIRAIIAWIKSEERTHFLARHRLASGEIRDVEVYSSPIEVRGRALLFSIIHDITERQRAEETLKRTQEALQRSNVELQARAEELDAFAHTVAHDLKTPLNVISGYAELLTEVAAGLSPEDVQENARTIMDVVGKMAGIVDSLLLLASARQESIPAESLNMAEIVAEAQRRLATEIAGRRAEIMLPLAWPIAIGYAPWVEAVWVNYLSNALKYGGRPDLTPPVPPRIVLDAQVQADGRVRFSVCDNGQGIAVADQERLFMPFTRVGERRDAGHGLGLSIVRRIVERLGGQVGLESTPGAGSTFYFTLPGNS